MIKNTVKRVEKMVVLITYSRFLCTEHPNNSQTLRMRLRYSVLLRRTPITVYSELKLPALYMKSYLKVQNPQYILPQLAPTGPVSYTHLLKAY